jgi:hemerythrin superfamily protein
MDAIELLKRDHQEVTKLFQRFFGGGEGGRGRRQLVQEICNELDVHSQIEEQVFYPAVRETGDEQLRRQVDEALQEHQRVKEQVTALRRMDAEDEGQLESMVSTLEQDVERHVIEEEGEMFPRLAEVMGEDERAAIGERLASLKQELKGEEGRGRTTSGRRGGRAAARRKAQPRRGRSSGGAGGQSAGGGRGQATGRRKTASGGAGKAGGSSERRRLRTSSSTKRSRTPSKRKSARAKSTGRKSRTGKKQVRGGRRR